MRSDTKSELQMLREVAWFFLHDKVCYFCQCYLIDSPKRMGVLVEGLTFGHRHHQRFPQDITLHHIDENRDNNKRENLAWCHDSCHRSHHTRKRSALRKEIIRRYESQEVNTEEETTQEIPAPRSLLNE
jgi:hypothetical protein